MIPAPNKSHYFLREQKRSSCKHSFCSRRHSLKKEQAPFPLTGRSFGCLEDLPNVFHSSDIKDVHFSSFDFKPFHGFLNIICDNQEEAEQALLYKNTKGLSPIIHLPLTKENASWYLKKHHPNVFFYQVSKEVYPFDLPCSFFSFLEQKDDSQHIFPTAKVSPPSPTSSSTFDWSIIIPVHQNTDLLRESLNFFSSLPNEEIELVFVVDENEEDSLYKVLQNFSFNLQVICLSQTHQRAIGSGSYRAASARNWGASFSKAKNLLFMDPDIILPPHSFSLLNKEIKPNSILQPIRHHIEIKNLGKIKEHHFDPKLIRPFEQSSGDYFWEGFYKEGENWNQLEFRWKYVSSYTLALKKESFIKVGGFNHSFTRYGFEDVDLGYRLIKENHCPKLLDLHVYHIDHRSFRSEYQGQEEKRQQVLKEMANHFYALNMKKDISQGLDFYLRDYTLEI